MLRSQTLRDLSSYLSLHISVCALASACCSFLPPPQPPVGSRTPPLAPHCPLHARTHTRAQAAGVITQAGPTDHSDALATASGPNNPVCSRRRSPVCAPGGVDEPYAPPPPAATRVPMLWKATRWSHQQRPQSGEQDGSPACCFKAHAGKQRM